MRIRRVYQTENCWLRQVRGTLWWTRGVLCGVRDKCWWARPETWKRAVRRGDTGNVIGTGYRIILAIMSRSAMFSLYTHHAHTQLSFCGFISVAAGNSPRLAWSVRRSNFARHATILYRKRRTWPLWWSCLTHHCKGRLPSLGFPLSFMRETP